FILNPTDGELLSLYQRCYAIVYPTFNEDWGMVPIEAMACEKPVIAVARGGPTETVIHGVTGLLAEPTVESFANALMQLVRMGDAVRKMRTEAFNRAQLYGWDRFVERIDEVLSCHFARIARSDESELRA